MMFSCRVVFRSRGRSLRTTVSRCSTRILSTKAENNNNDENNEKRKSHWEQFKGEWYEVKEAINQNIPDEHHRIEYADLPLEDQKAIREKTWMMFGLNNEQLAECIKNDPLFREHGSTTSSDAGSSQQESESSSESPHHVDRPKGALEELIARAKTEAMSHLPPEEAPPTDAAGFARLAMKNKQKLQQAAVSRLQVLEEIIVEFNDSYHQSKQKSVDEILAKEDYFENIKNSLIKVIGLDSVDEPTTTTTTTTTEAKTETEKPSTSTPVPTPSSTPPSSSSSSS